MARLIRRHSMERLELYDLDKLIQLQPSLLPPTCKRQDRRPSINPTFERYQFLCNMTRSKTDPIYAATPMFTTIPQSLEEKTHRQLLGSQVPLQNVKPITEDTEEEKENDDHKNKSNSISTDEQDKDDEE
jgi:hypothetical protein